MIKIDKNGIKLRRGDWVMFEFWDVIHVGQITKLHTFSAYEIVYKQDNDITITMFSGDRSIRPCNTVEKISEERAMLLVLEN